MSTSLIEDTQPPRSNQSSPAHSGYSARRGTAQLTLEWFVIGLASSVSLGLLFLIAAGAVLKWTGWLKWVRWTGSS